MHSSVLSMFASNCHQSHGQSHKQSHGKKLWSNLGSLKCNQDLSHALGLSAKKKEKININKIHQVSLESNLIVHKIKEMQES
jgi:hypothetical protein